MPGDDWFWDEQWQAGEREASAQIAAGEGDVYESEQERRDRHRRTLPAV